MSCNVTALQFQVHANYGTLLIDFDFYSNIGLFSIAPHILIALSTLLSLLGYFVPYFVSVFYIDSWLLLYSIFNTILNLTLNSQKQLACARLLGCNKFIHMKFLAKYSKTLSVIFSLGIDLNHDFYVVVGKNVVQKMRRQVTNTISLDKFTNVLLLFICFELVNFKIYFHFSKKYFQYVKN